MTNVYPQIMLDLETLGNGPKSAIIAIGAVKFSPAGGGMHDFYCTIDPEDAVREGLKMDAGTVMWWMQQSEQARKAFTNPGLSLRSALQAFREWYGSKETPVWGNGASFDNVILGNAYKAIGESQPWKFWNDRCYRTVKSMYPHIKLKRVGTYHNALDDAKSQAEHLQAIWQNAGW